MTIVEPESVFGSIADGVVVHDPSTAEILTVNDAYCEMVGHSEGELVGMELGDLAAEGWDYENDVQVKRARADGAVTFEWLVTTTEGEELPVEVRLTLTTYNGDEVAVASLRETPERRERKRELETLRRREQALFDNNQLILWEMDLSAAKEYADQIASNTDDFVGYLDDHPEEIGELNRRIDVEYLNQKTLEFYEADSEAELLANLDETITQQSFQGLKHLWADVAAGKTTIRKECEVSTLEDNLRHELLEWHIPEAYADDYSRAYAASVDITERKEREQELRRKNELLDEFASVVSHDITTPLGIIENKAQLIEMTEDPSHASDIQEASERVQKLVDRLRTLASEGKRVGETSPVDIETVVREAWRSMKTPHGTLHVESTTTIEAGRSRLSQLFENLLTNAVEHGVEQTKTDDPADETVTITVGTLSDGFYVADDGSGIPEAHREDIFEQGFTTSENGTGLGLAIVSRVVDGHDWTIDVTDSEEGGACFEIRTE